MKFRRNTYVVLFSVLVALIMLSMIYIPILAEASTISSAEMGTSSTYNIYTNLEYSNSDNWGLSYHKRNDNQIAWMQGDVSEDGFLKLQKSSNAQLCIRHG